MEKIAALLTVYNRKETTLESLHRIYSNYLPVDISLHVYLTDDGCTDGTPEAVKEKFPDVRIIKGDGTLYWNRGMIVAWEEAAKQDYDFYLWLNDDTNLYSDSISRLLIESSLHHDKSIIVGSTCATTNKNVITYGGWNGRKKISNVSETVKCDTMNGNIVLIPRSVFENVGYNDPYYRHALGDLDYGLTASRKGVSIYTGKGIYGECDLHKHPTIWMDPSQPFMKRWTNFMSPNGNNPFEFFYFRRKNFGLFSACGTFVSNWFHFLFPWLWPGKYRGYVNS